jgi:protoporphyrin/coproporphyrin ferrochelatase
MDSSPQPGSRCGVLLVNLGGPERLEDVRPFLFNLFSDPAILRLRFAPLRKALAWSIALLRAPRSRGYYAKIGGGSPLRRLTEEQAVALEACLGERGIEARVRVGMSCWTPAIPDALQGMVAEGVTDLVVLPLYPQFSITTTGSALEVIEAWSQRNGRGLHRRTIRHWFDHPGYVEALADTIREETGRFPDPDPQRVHLLYSAHSIPQRLVEEGDPYLEQTRATVGEVNRRLGERSPWTLAFQSKVGPVRWLEPATDQVIESLGRQGVRQVLVVPVSFVSDHSETLYEIDLLYRQQAASAGIAEFRRSPALNSRPRFIEALADLVQAELSAERGVDFSRRSG